MDDPAVETQTLTKRYGEAVAVDRLDLQVRRASIFGLLGPNGAGKSTVLRMLTTLLPPTSGTARVAGFDVRTEAREVRRRIGYVPQLVSADGTLTARENLRLSGALYGIPRRELRERVEEALSFMGLLEAADRLVRGYSGGMIRRLEIASAMLHRPEVMFLDEPTVGLDPVARHAVWDHLRELRVRLGATVLLTTHDMEEADALCDHVAILHGGRVAVQGVPSELEAAIGPDATMDDVFLHHTGAEIGPGGGYADARSTRRTAQRLG